MTLARTERLILFSAGVAARRQQVREHARQLTAQLDWRLLTEELWSRRLLPTLGPRVLELTGGRASEDFATAVEQALQAGRRQGAVLQLACQRVMTALADSGIRSAPLKGPLLSEALYGDPGRRVSSDIDLLVAPEQLPAAVEVVRSLGFAAPTDFVERSGLPRLHFLLMHAEQKLPPVELHWRVHCYERDFARERLLPPASHAPPDWRPEAADQLIALLLFYARDGFIDLRLASDLSAWWDAYGTELQLGAVEERLRTYPQLGRVVRVAARVGEKVVGLPTTQVFEDLPTLNIREHLAIRLANPNPRASHAQLHADMGLIDGLLAPPGGFGAFVRRQVLLPRDVLKELDRRAPKRRARSSLGRAVGMLGRYALSMTRTGFAPKETLDPQRLAATRSHSPADAAEVDAA